MGGIGRRLERRSSWVLLTVFLFSYSIVSCSSPAENSPYQPVHDKSIRTASELCDYVERFFNEEWGVADKFSVDLTDPVNPSLEIGLSGKCQIRSSKGDFVSFWIYTHESLQAHKGDDYSPTILGSSTEFLTVDGNKIMVNNSRQQWDFRTEIDGWAGSLTVRQSGLLDSRVLTNEEMLKLGKFFVRGVREFQA